MLLLERPPSARSDDAEEPKRKSFSIFSEVVDDEACFLDAGATSFVDIEEDLRFPRGNATGSAMILKMKSKN